MSLESYLSAPGLSSAVKTPRAQAISRRQTRVLTKGKKSHKFAFGSTAHYLQGLAATHSCKKGRSNNQNTHATAPRPPRTKLTRAHKLPHIVHIFHY